MEGDKANSISAGSYYNPVLSLGIEGKYPSLNFEPGGHLSVFGLQENASPAHWQTY